MAVARRRLPAKSIAAMLAHLERAVAEIRQAVEWDDDETNEIGSSGRRSSRLEPELASGGLSLSRRRRCKQVADELLDGLGVKRKR